MNKSISNETKNEAMKVAKATQKPGQTKEQTKLIALGIEKGIAEYKKQQKSKAREKDKARKQEIKAKNRDSEQTDEVQIVDSNGNPPKLPWALLLLSWAGFFAYLLMR
ncbi:membrane protein [Shewanella colwelliana]|uniref:Membrane protein n=1 Tax=Shewanella colwelliana TaxID=23 RepID=A0ABQ4NYH1_SHECO|nr:DUF2956 domain-containing protein [Shewanella colwelliana]MDX1281762.1 DUF2956 domain-containing protein [Shewanella colwelliana]GIU22124.1 membrane protein [Shewanella colwelliana]GIU39892.1 membrane protein [Shewanella colwelliana]